MVLNLTRFAVLLAGDRLIAAVLHRGRLDTFSVEAEQPAAALRAEIDARKLHLTTAAVGLPRTSVAVKPIELPDIDGDARDMVRFELERHLPFPADDAPFDFIPLPADAGRPGASAPGRRVLIVAADRRVLDTTLRIVEDAGLRAVSVTVAAHELVNLVDQDPARRVVWIHRSGDNIDLLFLAGGATIVLSRNVSAGDAELLAGDIRQSFALLRWRGCDAIWVSGDTTAADTSDAVASLGASVTAPPYNVRARQAMAGLHEEGRGARELAVGLVLGRGARPLDLLPLPLRPRRITRSQIITAGSAVAAVVLGIAALLVPGYRDSRRLAEINAAVSRTDPEVRAVENTLKELERKRKLLATIESLDGNAIKPLPVLRDLTELLPTDAWLTMVSLDGKGVELTGQAAAASALIPLLENSPRLERVEFASPVMRGRDREQFRILAKWEASGATAVALPPAAPVAQTPPTPPTAPVARVPRAGVPPVAGAPPPVPHANAPPPSVPHAGAPPAVVAPPPPDVEPPPSPPSGRRRGTPENLGGVREPRP